MMALLESLRDSLAALPGVASCRIGLEANISPADYPLIRVVPSRLEPGVIVVSGQHITRRGEVLIYFGMDVAQSEGLEAVYAALFEMESSILAKLSPPPAGVTKVQYMETITDEDRLETYKLMAVRCEVEG